MAILLNRRGGGQILMQATFMERVTPVVDQTIRALARKKFVADPVAGSKILTRNQHRKFGVQTPRADS